MGLYNRNTCYKRPVGISNGEPSQIFPLLVRQIYQNLRVRDLNWFTYCWRNNWCKQM